MQHPDHEADIGSPVPAPRRVPTRTSRYIGTPVERPIPSPFQRPISTADPAEAAAIFAASYEGGDFAVSPLNGAFSFRSASLDGPRVSLHSIECSGEVTGSVRFFSRYAVTWFGAGAGSVTVNSDTRHSAAAEPLMMPTERAFDVVLRPTRQNLIHFAPEFLEDVATEIHGGGRRALSFDLASPTVGDRTGRWRSAVGQVTAAARDAGASTLVRSNAERALAHALLALFTWASWSVPPEMRLPPAWRVRAALDHLHHHAGEPVTPADAARAAGIHTRTLQQATQRHLGMSPSAYLRDIRLERAHRDLRAASPGSDSVAAIAGRWGFGNLGRFAAAYGEKYGEKPSETLRQWR